MTIMVSTLPQMEVKKLNLKPGFWDADGFYFNRQGKDKNGGTYDDKYVYIPGKGWNSAKMCYEKELHNEYDDYGYVDLGKALN